MAKGANIMCHHTHVLDVHEPAKVEVARMEQDPLPRISEVDQLDFNSMSLDDHSDTISSCPPRPYDNDSMDTVVSFTAAAKAGERHHGFNTYSNLKLPPSVSIDEGFFSTSTNSCTYPSQEDHQVCRTVQASPAIDSREVYSQDNDGDTDLHIAIIQRQNHLALLFISVAPNCEYLDIVNHMLQSPLHLAVITRQKKIVRRLMIGGARLDSRDIHGNTPLHIACREGMEDIALCLLQHLYYEETLTNSYEIPYQRVPQNLNLRNYEGHTCLHLAAISTHIQVIDVLLNKGADVNIGDGRSGRTILHYASETGNRILLHYLLSQHRLDISCTTFGGLTPLRLASGRGFGDVVTILIEHGAYVGDIDFSDDESIDDYHVHGHPLTV